jgi:hypothetical protein
MAVEPVDTPVRFQVGLVEDPPDRRPAHDLVMMGSVDQRGGQVVQRPARYRLFVFGGRPTGQGDHVKPFRGGKTSAADPTAEHPEAQPTHARDTGFARSRRCGDHSETRRRSGGWWARRRRRPSRSSGIGRPGLEAWTRLAPRLRAEDDLGRSGGRAPRKAEASRTSVMWRSSEDLRDDGY